MVGVGLVLGGGGVAGQAYHAGVLSALEHDFGWDPRHAKVIVGTSAGSIIATLLRSGVAASELAAWTVRASTWVQSDMLMELFGDESPELQPFRFSDLVRTPSLPSQALLRRVLLRPWKFRPSAALLTLLAPGPFDIKEHLAPLRDVETSHWPDRDLWITAVRRLDGRRVVFGRPGAPLAPLHLAVSASCAIPGYFAPVEIDGRQYVDGGVHSPTNAAILAHSDLDLVVVVSPMSGPASPTDVIGLLRRHAGRRLSREVAALRRSGRTVIVFEPGSAVQAAMGRDFLSRDSVDHIVREAFLASGAYAARSDLRNQLADIATR